MTMHTLPAQIAESLTEVADGNGDPLRLAKGLRGLLDAELACADLARGIEAFRDASRNLGILEEARSGQRIYEAWSRLSRFFLEPLERLKDALCGAEGSTQETTEGFEVLGSRWERMSAELSAFLDEQRALDRTLLEAPVSTHVGYQIRSRLLLLDRRSERLKVALDLTQRNLAAIAHSGAKSLENLLGGVEEAEEAEETVDGSLEEPAGGAS